LRLLLDEIYPATVAEQLRARGHDVISLHDPDYRSLEGAPDDEVFVAAIATKRALVTENVPDFRRLEADALANGEPCPSLIFTTNRQFPRGNAATVGRLVLALNALLLTKPALTGATFLKATP
jgi:predicted nuclease of predicted toxin-antitoxin system